VPLPGIGGLGMRRRMAASPAADRLAAPPVTPERLKQIETIYHAAMSHPDAERLGFLRSACAGDDELREEVEALIAVAGASLSVFDMPAVNVFGAVPIEGSLVGHRFGAYQVTELLGAGGMGEVYRATDTKLGRDVAIKVLPAEFSASPERLRRFEQEARLLAALNQPNIGAIYGLEDADGVRGLVLELVEGPTLADRLAAGPIALTEALSIARQIAEALAAAHDKGIVHRDLKPANVKVTPQGVVKVLDFGIAKPSAGDSVNFDTREGVILGTAAYMSPEQTRGQSVDARTDIWAFGCVLYEMLTGQTPFAAKTAVDTMAAIVGREPDWTLVPPGVPASLERLLRQCLEKEAPKRPAGMRAVLSELDRVAADTSHASQILRRGWLYAAAAVLVVGAWLISGARHQPQALNARPKPRRAIAVMGFKNLSGRTETAWLSPALSETLTMEIGTGGTLRAIPGESVARMKIDLAADVDSFAQDTLNRIRSNLGADLLILGSYLAVGREGEERIRLDLRLQDAATGDIVATVTETGIEPELLELVSRAGAHLREKLGIGVLSEADSAVLRASLPSSPDVVRLYSEGLDKLRLFDALLARDLLERAVAADPTYALAHSALASAWSDLGYDSRATAEAKKAMDLSGKLSREQRLAIEGTYRELAHEWENAAKIYKALWTVFPDNVEYGLHLARVESARGLGKDALSVVEQLRELPPPASDDARIDLEEEVAAGSLSDFKRQQAAAERAAAKGQAQGARLLLARARLRDSRALYDLGDLPKSVAMAQSARDIYAASGDRAGEAAALNNIATVTADRGEIVKATQMHEEAVEIFRQIGNKKGMANALNNIALLLKNAGDLTGARKVHEQVLALRREIGDRNGAAVSLSNLGVVFFEQGDLTAAKRMYENSLSMSREIGDKRGAVRAMLNMAIVLTREGDLGGARTMHEESLAIRREIGDRRGAAVALINLAEVRLQLGDIAGAASSVQESLAIGRATDSKRTIAYALFFNGEVLEVQDRLKEARQSYEEALAVREQLRETVTIVESHIGLAELAIEEGNAADGEALARSAADESQRGKQVDNESLARLVLARALLAQRKLVEARTEIARCRSLLDKSENRQDRLALGITDARLSAEAGQRAAAIKAVEAVRGAAAKAGLAGVELEARLARGEIEMRSGNVGAGRARLETLQKDASARGFGLVARKSATASSSPP
jgi:tetratricopeptide (TPR) repeat protein/TolB-like protein